MEVYWDIRYNWKSSTVTCSWAPQQRPHAGVREVERGALALAGVTWRYPNLRCESLEEKLKELIAGEFCSSSSSSSYLHRQFRK